MKNKNSAFYAVQDKTKKRKSEKNGFRFKRERVYDTLHKNVDSVALHF